MIPPSFFLFSSTRREPRYFCLLLAGGERDFIFRGAFYRMVSRKKHTVDLILVIVHTACLLPFNPSVAWTRII